MPYQSHGQQSPSSAMLDSLRYERVRPLLADAMTEECHVWANSLNQARVFYLEFVTSRAACPRALLRDSFAAPLLPDSRRQVVVHGAI
mmetsp:Transcript_45486/g.126580  ORF Transcript_45486/g.126580 Transcript_45486/m.126580 type:complete len:88 (-) Transcript_45486:99-362(-)